MPRPQSSSCLLVTKVTSASPGRCPLRKPACLLVRAHHIPAWPLRLLCQCNQSQPPLPLWGSGLHFLPRVPLPPFCRPQNLLALPLSDPVSLIMSRPICPVFMGKYS